MNERISLIIPAFNEALSIDEVLQDIGDNLAGLEVIVVDDGSSDGTGEIAKPLCTKVLTHDHNRGYGASIRTGVLGSTREYVLFCDADGQHTADNIKKVIQSVEDYDMVVGARDKGSYHSKRRMLGKYILKKFADFLAGETIPDFNSGLRIINKKCLMNYLHLMPDGFSFSTTSTFALLKARARIKWIPITVKKRIGESTVRQLKHGPQALMLMLRITVLFEPLKVFLSVAGVMLILSLASFCIDMFSSEGQGIADTTVLLFISTLGIFLFSLLCDQISAIRREIHKND